MPLIVKYLYFQTVQDVTMNPNNLVTGTKAFRLNVTFQMRTEECMVGYTTEPGRMKTMIHLFMKAFNNNLNKWNDLLMTCLCMLFVYLFDILLYHNF